MTGEAVQAASDPTIREHLVPGFLLCSLAGVVLMVVGTNGVVRGTDASGVERTLRFGTSVYFIAALMIGLFGMFSLSARRPVLRIWGLVFALSAAFFPALALIAARTDSRFAKNTPVELLTSGKLAIVVSGLALAAFAVALLRPAWAGGESRSPARAIILSAAGTLFFPLAAFGMGFGMLERARSDERVQFASRGAVIIGAVAVVGWTVLVVVGVLTFHR